MLSKTTKTLLSSWTRRAQVLSTVQGRQASSQPPAPSEQFLSGTASRYGEAMYQAWQADPNSVHVSWRTFFENEERGYGKGQSYSSPPGLVHATPVAPPTTGMSSLSSIPDQDILNHIKVERLIRAYETRGHNIANLDPLGISNADLSSEMPSELTMQHYNFTQADLERTVVVPPTPIFDPKSESKLPLKQVLDKLQKIFCGHIGYEYMFIQERDRINWIQNKIAQQQQPLPAEMKQKIMTDLIAAREFELFLQKKFVSEKRFGIDGCESLIAGMKQLLRRGSDLGIQAAILGMPHRGRLNVLHNVMTKPVELIFKEFQSNLASDDEGSGDVKYHLGMSSDVKLDSGESIHLSLMANPSHLEAVNPVVEGKCRAEQDYRGDFERKRVVPILLHGDAAFAGQGVVYETLGFSQLPAYTTGGTVHIVVNNQIGFTTDPRFSRSTPYSTDIAKMVGAPVFHVNGDDAEAVVRCCQAAIEWRQEFGTDVVVDIVCYRRFGHNESDQPAFTQPRMYEEIKKMNPVDNKYFNEVSPSGVFDQKFVDDERERYTNSLSVAWDNSDKSSYPKGDYYGAYWSKLKTHPGVATIYQTGVDRDLLLQVGRTFSQYPEDFKVHKSLTKILRQRLQSIEEDTGLDWATAEGLAFGTALVEGTTVRLSGQDVERGTFSQRHHVLHDQETDGKTYTSLKEMQTSARYTVSNSHLSEYAVLGFELGFSMTNPDSLVCWEAQFGDFSNTAQCIIDQFIAAGEHKWKRMTGLTMLLPHGYEGMGPEHSSARLERFLQLCNDDEDVYPDMEPEVRTQIQDCNMQVVNCSTPANYFHVLRRQVHRDVRKPLIVMTPKSLLRHPRCKSTLSEIETGTEFRRLIEEEDDIIRSNPDDVSRVVFCSGKVYYDLLEEREKLGSKNVAIARVEQISPFPFDLVHSMMDQYPQAEVVWCQEEPKNMGAWNYVKPRISTALSKSSHHAGSPVAYVGRPPSASVAAGDKKTHAREQKDLIGMALN